MALKEIANSLDDSIGKLSTRIAYVGAYCLFFMTLLVAVHVLSRYFFNFPIPGAVEIIQFTMVCVVFLGFGYGAYNGANVAVEVVMDKLPLKFQRIGAILVNILSGLIVSLIIWQGCVQAIDLYDSKQISGVLHIPHYPFFGILVLGYLVFVIVLITKILRLIAGAK